MAGFGLAALVGTGVGVALAKTGRFAKILILAKKFIIVLLAVGAGLFNRLKKMIGSEAPFGPPAAGPPAVRSGLFGSAGR